jgi:hypothetical protein
MSVHGVSCGGHSPTATSAPSLDQLILSGSLISYQQVRVITVIQSFFLPSQSLFQDIHPNFLLFLDFFNTIILILLLSLSHNNGGCNSWSGQCSHLSGSYSVHYFFLCFGGGRHLHTLQILICKNPLDILTTCFTIFPPKISYGVLLGVPPLPR